MRHLWLLILASAPACVGHADETSRERLGAALEEMLGKEAEPLVAFQKDSTHLVVQLSTFAFPTVSDPALTEQAKTIASFALGHYEKPNELDSVTVRYREKAPAPGVWYIRHTRTFPVENIRTIR